MTHIQIYLFGVAVLFLILIARYLTTEKVRRSLTDAGYQPLITLRFIAWTALLWPLSAPLIIIVKILKLRGKIES